MKNKKYVHKFYLSDKKEKTFGKLSCVINGKTIVYNEWSVNGEPDYEDSQLVYTHIIDDSYWQPENITKVE